jgi:hypothetical protein
LSPTSKSGNPDTSAEAEAVASEQPELQERSIPLVFVLLAVVVLILAVVIGSQVIGVLYVIVVPPAPPLPEDVTLISHTNSDYGVDAWVYTSNQPACEVVEFYIEQGGQCHIAPTCDAVSTSEPALPNVENTAQNVARCVGKADASIFALRWQAIIATGRTPDVATEFRVEREMFWTGAVPPITQPVLE